MKKIVVISLILLMVVAMFAFAEESTMFVKTMPIIRIYSHRMGFKVLYLKNNFTLGEFYVPLRWFDEAAAKGLLVKGLEAEYPYFSIFWKDGEFHSVKLYVKENLQHATWGTLGREEDVTGKFDVDSLVLEF